MTPECPKGAEREAQIEIKRLEENEEFLERAVHLVLGCCDASDVPCEEPDAGVLYEHVRHGTAPQSMRAVAADVERITAELQAQNRLYRNVGAERDEKQFEIERLRRWVDRFRAGLQESRAQVERTRRAERRSIASVLTGMLEELEAAYALEFGEGPAPSREKLREVQKFSVDLFATSGPVELDEFESGGPSSEVEAPQQEGFVPACPACVRTEQHTIDQLQWFHRDGLELIAEAAQEARSATSEASTEDAALLAVAEDRARNDNGVRHSLDDVMDELGVGSASTPPASGSAKRSGCCFCGYNRHNLSGCADCACTVMQHNHHHAPEVVSSTEQEKPGE